MNLIKYFLLGLVLVFSVVLKAQKINSEKSVVSFSISNMKVNTVEGTIKGMQGMVVFNPKNLKDSKFNVCIDPETINTENEKRDKHLKNEDFFNVENYPSICFVSEEIKKTDAGYQVLGKLTLHGITRTIVFPFSVYKNKDNWFFKGVLEINRFDFKLAAESYSSTFMVGETVEIEILCKLDGY